jgi:hypothetical protein
VAGKLQDQLCWAPRWLREDRAAAYCGMGKTHFRASVEDDTLPEAINVNGVKVWDRLALDAAIEALAEESDERENSADKVLRLDRK